MLKNNRKRARRGTKGASRSRVIRMSEDVWIRIDRLAVAGHRSKAAQVEVIVDHYEQTATE